MNKQEYEFNYRVYRRMGKISDGTFFKVLRMQGADDRVIKHFEQMRRYDQYLYVWMQQGRKLKAKIITNRIRREKYGFIDLSVDKE